MALVRPGASRDVKGKGAYAKKPEADLRQLSSVGMDKVDKAR